MDELFYKPKATMKRPLPSNHFRTMCGIRWIAIVLGIASAACAAARPNDCGDWDDLEWGPPVDGQALSISTTQESYAPGQPIALRASLKNTGKDDVHYSKKYTLDENRISVRLPNGKPAPLTLYGTERFSWFHSSGTSYRILKPNQMACDHIELSRLFDFSLEGTYTVSVEREVFAVENGDIRHYDKVSSNRLQISVDGSNPPNAKPGVRAVSAEVEGTKISMWMPRKSVLGQSVPISISIWNKGDKTIYFDERACPPDARMKLRRLDETSRPEVKFVADAAEKFEGKSQVGPRPGINDLPAGNECTSTVDLNEWFQLTRGRFEFTATFSLLRRAPARDKSDAINIVVGGLKFVVEDQKPPAR